MRTDFGDLGAEHIDLSSVDFTPELLQCIPAEMARKFRVLPISQTEEEFKVVFAAPTNLDNLDLNNVDVLAQYLNRPINICVADGREIDAYVERLYGKGQRA